MKAVLVIKGGTPEFLARKIVNYLENLGFEVREGEWRENREGEVLNRWYPGILRSVEDIVNAGVPGGERVRDLTYLTAKRSYTHEDERKVFETVEAIPDNHELFLIFKSAVDYMRRPVKYLVLRRTVEREEVVKRMGLTEEEVDRIFPGWREADEQDFVKKVVVGATDVSRAHRGSLRNLIWEEVKDDPQGILGLSYFHPRLHNVVHCPSSDELATEIMLMTPEEKRLWEGA